MVFLFLVLNIPVNAGDDFGQGTDSKESKKILKESVFSVSTDDFNSSESLNRISGEYDLGYSSLDQSFKSKDQDPAGPFAHEKAEISKQNSY